MIRQGGMDYHFPFSVDTLDCQTIFSIKSLKTIMLNLKQNK